MSSERMQQFLRGVAKGGELTFEKFYAPLPYGENTPMSNVCVAFVRSYNDICQAKEEGRITPQAASVNIARLHEDTFGDARTEKYAKFNDLFFARALANTPRNKQLLSELKKTYVPSSNPFDNSLMADLIVGGVKQVVTWPFRVVGNLKRDVGRRENIKIMAAIDEGATSLDRRTKAIEGVIFDSAGKELRPLTPESFDAISQELASIEPEISTLHEQMDRAEGRKILSAMAAESADKIDASNNALLRSRAMLEEAAKKWPALAEECEKQHNAMKTLLDDGATIRAEVRAHAAQLEFQSKNMEDILRLRIETGESLSKSDVKILETARDDIQQRMRDLDKTLSGPHAKAVAEQDQSDRLKEFKARMEAFNVRMEKIDLLLSDPKVKGNNFMSDELKASLKALVNLDAMKKIGEALRSLFDSFRLGK